MRLKNSLKEKQSPLVGYFSDGALITALAYMADVFMLDKVEGFQKKIHLWWKNTMKEGNASMFQSQSEVCI